MSDVINSFIQDFRAQTTIAQDLRTNFYPMVAPKSALPVTVYEYSDGVRESLYSGSFGLRTSTIVLNMYSLNYDQLVTARDAIESRYSGFSGNFTLGTGASATTVLVQRIVMNDSFFALQDGNDKVYRCTIELDLIS